MSRTVKGSKGPGYEYWSKREYSGYSPCSEIKRLTNRKERRINKDEQRCTRITEASGRVKEKSSRSGQNQ